MKLHVAILALTGLAPTLAWCDDAPPPPPDGVWTGKGQGGYTASQGNSDAKSANAALDAAVTEGPWKHALHLDGLYGESAGVVAAERWDANWQSNYDLTSTLYTFGGLRYQHDLFSGFQYQASATAGVGYKIFNSNATKLDVQVGAGYTRFRPEDLTTDPDGHVTRTELPTQGGAIGTVGVNYSQVLTPTTTITDKFLLESGSDDTLVTNTLALAVKVSTKLALSVGYNVQDNTSPPGGVKKLDYLETLNLVYAF
jgi:putative salt-induced outer membrane protein